MRWRATVAVAGVLSATVAAVGECALKRLDTIANKSSAITNYIFIFYTLQINQATLGKCQCQCNDC